MEQGGIPLLLLLFPGKATPPCSSHYKGKKVPAESGDEKGCDNFSNYWHSLLLLPPEPHFGALLYVAYQLQRVLSSRGSLSGDHQTGDTGYFIKMSNI